MEWLRKGKVTVCCHFLALQTFLRLSSALCAGTVKPSQGGRSWGQAANTACFQQTLLLGLWCSGWWGGEQLKPCPADTFCRAVSKLLSGMLVFGRREIAHHSIQPLASAADSAVPTTAPHPSRGGRAESHLLRSLDLILHVFLWEEASVLLLVPPHIVGCLCPGTCLRKALLPSKWLERFHKLDYYTV